MKRLIAAILWLGSPAYAQQPDHRGEVVLTEPVFNGVRANAPIPPEMHFKNTGGSDGAGLCVDTSMTIAGAYHGIADLWKLTQSALMVDARANPGGSWPEKLERELKDHYPNEQWFMWESPTTEQVEAFNAQGLAVCTTTNTGALYNYDYIYHYIVTIHLDDVFAMIVDSNDPGRYHAMPRAEFDRRAPNPDKMWATVWLSGRVEKAESWTLLASVVVCCAALYYSDIFNARPELS